MNTINYAVIGLGVIARNRIIKEGFAFDKSRFEPLENVRLVGVNDVDPSKVKVAKRLGLKWFDTSEEVFLSKDIDAVIIATNNSTHAELATKAIKAGKHCIVEKPMTINMKEAKALQDLAIKNGVSLAVDHMMEHNVYNKKAQQLIAENRIGEVNDICLHMEMLYGKNEKEKTSWRCSQPENSGGPIADLGSHCFYMAEFILQSKIKAVSCCYYPNSLGIKVENGAYIKFETEQGLTGSIRVAFNEPRGGLMSSLSNLGYEIYGSEGVLRTYATMFQLSGHKDEPVMLRLEVEDCSDIERYEIPVIDNMYQSVINSHANSISSGKYNDGSEGTHNLELITAAHKSANQGGDKIWIS